MAGKEKLRLNFVDKFISFFSARAGLERTRARLVANELRAYEAASRGRRAAGWKSSGASANSEIQGSIRVLRNRSRQLVRDNAYAARGLQSIVANTVGKGIFTQVKVESGKQTQNENKLANDREKDLSRRWKAWANSTAVDYDGRNNLVGIQRLVLRSVVESGEVLIRLRRNRRRVIKTPEGFEVEVPPISLQVLESDFLDHEQLSTATVGKGNTLIQGIEFDKSGNRVAYHLYKEHPGETAFGFGKSFKSLYETVRVPADEVLHVYRQDRPGQIRGVPWLSPAMLRLRDLDDYQDAQLMRQKIASCFAIFIRDIDGVNENAQTGDEELGEKVEPGIIEHLGPGKTIEMASPPGVEGYAEFVNVELRAVASALGVTFETLTGDLSQVNFSSARMGFLDMQRNIEEWRNLLVVGQFLLPVWSWFENGLDLLGVNVSRARAVHTAPRREMIDPVKETDALKAAVRSGFITQSEAVRMQGADPEQHFKDLKTDMDKLDELGIVLDTDPRQDPNRVSANSGQASQS